jgi:hypothetical protein
MINKFSCFTKKKTAVCKKWNVQNCKKH